MHREMTDKLEAGPPKDSIPEGTPYISPSGAQPAIVPGHICLGSRQGTWGPVMEELMVLDGSSSIPGPFSSFLKVYPASDLAQVIRSIWSQVPGKISSWYNVRNGIL